MARDLKIGVTLGWKGDSFDRAFDALTQEITETVRGLSVLIWNSILIKTPQAHGTLVASWTYSIGAPHYDSRETEVDLASGMYRSQRRDANLLRRRGDPLAMAIANAASSGRDRTFVLGDTIYISNGADHGEGFYAEAVESGAISLRAVNLPGAMVQRTLDMIDSRFGTGYKFTPAKAKELRSLTLGSSNAS